MKHNFSLNIISFQDENKVWIAQCSQMPGVEECAMDEQEAIDKFINTLHLKALDKRNAMIQYLGKQNTEFNIHSIPCYLNSEEQLSASSDTDLDVQRKIEIVHLYQKAGYPQAEGSLTRPCEKQYLLSIKDADLDKEKLRLENKIR